MDTDIKIGASFLNAMFIDRDIKFTNVLTPQELTVSSQISHLVEFKCNSEFAQLHKRTIRRKKQYETGQ